ncbi:MAG: hypothetical protein ABI877_11550 [Gemmatimonadaceae bacterium]
MHRSIVTKARAVAMACLSLGFLAGCDVATDPIPGNQAPDSHVSLSAGPPGIPIYSLTTIPADVAWRINQSGDVVGWTAFPPQPYLYTPENGVIMLPTAPPPPGQEAGIARDVSNRVSGVLTVVGEARLASSGGNLHAVRWRVAVPQGTVIDVTDLGTLPQHVHSEARGVNSSGQIVGSSDPNSLLSVRAFGFTDATGMVDLGLGGVGFSAYAHDINDAGVITGYLGTHAFRWTTAGGLDDLGVPPGWNFSTGYSINASNQVAGGLTTASGNAQAVARYSDGAGWKILGGLGQRNTGWGLNDWGDVVGTGIAHTGIFPSRQGVVFTDVLGTLVYVRELLANPSPYTVMEAYDINNAQQIVGWASNNVGGANTAVLLNRVGTLQAPNAPSNLTAIPEPPDQQVPYIRIQVSAQDNSTNEQGFLIERKGPTDATFLPVSNSSSSQYTDANITPCLSYAYRVSAFNYAGSSATTAIVSAVAPCTGNYPPSAALSATSPTNILVGGSVSVSGSFFDPDHGPWKYAFAWGNGRTSGTSLTTGVINATRTYTKAGTYRIAFGVADALALADTSNVVTVHVR